MFFVSKARHEREIASLTTELDEMNDDREHYRSCWLAEHDQVKNLEKQLQNKTIEHSTTKMHYTEAMCLYHKMSAEVMTVKPENAILRQILEDLTGQSADDLIEAHKRAVRKLEYGVTVPALSESKEDM
jgi:hypothetical protein